MNDLDPVIAETAFRQGGMDVDRLNELFGTRPGGKESATIAGLVSELAGRIPRKGEAVEEDGLRFEVLESTDRKIERVLAFKTEWTVRRGAVELYEQFLRFGLTREIFAKHVRLNHIRQLMASGLIDESLCWRARADVVA